MFREMRLKRQALDEGACREILKDGSIGVLSVAGDDGYPYGVPLNYVYDEQAGKIYFHSARDGHKLDAIRREPKVSFCVVGKNQLVPEEFTTYFTSVIAFGRATVLTDDREREAALRLLSEKYVKAPKERVDAEIAKSFPAVCLAELAIEHLSGKQAIELVQA